jgi:hypothetical protein
MSGHSVRVRDDLPTTPEAFFADRQRFWFGFTSATFWAVLHLAVLLIVLAVWLL